MYEHDEPTEARAMRAAMGMARSAPFEPSRGNKIRRNIVLLLLTARVRESRGIEQLLLLLVESIYLFDHGCITGRSVLLTVMSQAPSLCTYRGCAEARNPFSEVRSWCSQAIETWLLTLLFSSGSRLPGQFDEAFFE